MSESVPSHGTEVEFKMRGTVCGLDSATPGGPYLKIRDLRYESGDPALSTQFHEIRRVELWVCAKDAQPSGDST